jgi:hypothetical protein
MPWPMPMVHLQVQAKTRQAAVGQALEPRGRRTFPLEDHAYIPHHRPALFRDSITLDQLPPTVHCDSRKPEATTADTCSIPLTLSSFRPATPSQQNHVLE